VELRPVPMEFGAEYLERSLKLGYTCRAINARAFRIHLKKRLCVGSMSEIEFNATCHSC
jgi:hypothetical protein